MSLVAVTGHAGVVAEAEALGLRSVPYETDIVRLKHVVAAIEDFRPLLRLLQKVSQCRYRSVVQIRRSRPDRVHEGRHIAAGRAELTELPVVVLRVSVVRGSRLRCPDLDAVRVGTNLVRRYDLSRTRAVRVVACVALLVEDRLAGGCQSRVDGETLGRILRRLELRQPVLQLLQLLLQMGCHAFGRGTVTD